MSVWVIPTRTIRPFPIRLISFPSTTTAALVTLWIKIRLKILDFQKKSWILILILHWGKIELCEGLEVACRKRAAAVRSLPSLAEVRWGPNFCVVNFGGEFCGNCLWTLSRTNKSAVVIGCCFLANRIKTSQAQVNSIPNQQESLKSWLKYFKPPNRNKVCLQSNQKESPLSSTTFTLNSFPRSRRN